MTEGKNRRTKGSAALPDSDLVVEKDTDGDDKATISPPVRSTTTAPCVRDALSVTHTLKCWYPPAVQRRQSSMSTSWARSTSVRLLSVTASSSMNGSDASVDATVAHFPENQPTSDGGGRNIIPERASKLSVPAEFGLARVGGASVATQQLSRHLFFANEKGSSVGVSAVPGVPGVSDVSDALD